MLPSSSPSNSTLVLALVPAAGRAGPSPYPATEAGTAYNPAREKAPSERARGTRGPAARAGDRPRRDPGAAPGEPLLPGRPASPGRGRGRLHPAGAGPVGPAPGDRPHG